MKASPEERQNPSIGKDSVVSSWTIGINTGPDPFVIKWKNDYYMIPEAHTETMEC